MFFAIYSLFKKEFNLSDHEREMVVSFLYLGSGLGALVGGHICDKNGENDFVFISMLLTSIYFIY